MIQESVGATPFGIFLLADEFLEAARRAAVGSHSSTSDAPARLLAYHACELYLKTYLRSHGSLIEDLRRHQHNLTAMMEAAKLLGLKPTKRIEHGLKRATDDNEYVRVRYLVARPSGIVPRQVVVNLAEQIRELVRLSLDFDEFGNPKGALWASNEPADLLQARTDWAEQ